MCHSATVFSIASAKGLLLKVTIGSADPYLGFLSPLSALRVFLARGSGTYEPVTLPALQPLPLHHKGRTLIFPQITIGWTSTMSQNVAQKSTGPSGAG